MARISCHTVIDHRLHCITQDDGSDSSIDLRKIERYAKLDEGGVANGIEQEDCSHGDGTRVPSELQNIFLLSNQGNDVHVPPPKGLATKNFRRSRWSTRVRTSFKWLASSFSSLGRHEGRRSLKVINTTAIKNSILSSNEAKNTLQSNGESTHPKAKIHCNEIVPHDFLSAKVRERGYSARRYKSLESAYFNKPTKYQQICYGSYVVNVVKSGDESELEALLSIGISPNACNSFGQSIVHMVCRLGHFHMLQVLLDFGCNIQIADDHGRTPLHYICHTENPSFDVVSMCLEIDCQMLFVQDSRGHVPLDYVRPSMRRKWIQFLEQNMSNLWPKRYSFQGEEPAPPITRLSPNSIHLKDPSNALPIKVAKMLAAGKISNDEAGFWRWDLIQSQTNLTNIGVVDEDDSTDSDISSNSTTSSSTGLTDGFSEHDIDPLQHISSRHGLPACSYTVGNDLCRFRIVTQD
jgi:Ankyrin repeats (3 copies)